MTTARSQPMHAALVQAAVLALLVLATGSATAPDTAGAQGPTASWHPIVGTWQRFLSSRARYELQLFPDGRFFEITDAGTSQEVGRGRYGVQSGWLTQVYDTTGTNLVSQFRLVREPNKTSAQGWTDWLILQSERFPGHVALARQTWSGRLFPP